MKLAGYLVFLSAALHLLAVLMAGFEADVLMLLTATIFYIVLGIGLLRGRRAVGWLTFFTMIIGIAFATSDLLGVSHVPDWTMSGILLADLAALGVLFAVLWRDPKARNSATVP